VNRIESSQRRRHRLCGSVKNGVCQFDNLESFHHEIYSLAPNRRDIRSQMPRKMQSIDCAQALDFDQSAGHPCRNAVPFP